MIVRSPNVRPGEFTIGDAKRLLQAIDAALSGLPVEDRLHALVISVSSAIPKPLPSAFAFAHVFMRRHA
jgi:hypothetical protein